MLYLYLMKFDLSPITPSLVKKVLKTRSSGSAPGEDGITYIPPSQDDAIYSPFSGNSFFNNFTAFSGPSDILDSCKDYHSAQERGSQRPRKFSTYRSDISDRKVVSQDPSYQIGGFPDMQFDGGQIIAKRVPTRTKWLH